MDDALKSVSLQALEEFTSQRSFGKAGLHPVSERPSLRGRKYGGSECSSDNRSASLQRHSLMNERTRVRRVSDANVDKIKSGKHTMRKRKSDELNSFDLSELDETVGASKLKHAIPPNHKTALDTIGNVFVDMNSRWQGAFQAHVNHHRQTFLDDEDELPIHPLSGAGSIFAKGSISPLETDVSSSFATIHSMVKAPPVVPETPTFLHFRDHSSASGGDVDSPCSVAALTRGCGVCFWERSLAWSEDDDDDDIVVTRHTIKSKDIREHLSVPQHLGKEFASTPVESDNSRNRAPLRLPSSSRIARLETDSRHKLPGAKMFRQTDVDEVTEIHWEEKLLDTTALEKMAKLSL